MSVTDAGRALRRRWLAVLLALVLGAAAGAVGAVVIPTTYSAKATLFVSSPAAADPAASVFEREQVAIDRTKSYALLVDDPRVLDQAIGRYRLPTTRVALSENVLVSNPYDSTLIDVETTGRTPGEAALFANAIGDSFATSAAAIGAGAQQGPVPAVTVGLIQPATPPDAPSSPRRVTTVLVGILLGLVIGLGYVLVRAAFDRSVTTTDALRARSGLPVLATTERDRRIAQRPVVVADDPDSRSAEAYRRLRTKLRMSDRADGTVLFIAGPPGAGRTTVALNLAVATADIGSRVLYVDADLRHPDGAVRAGVEPGAKGLSDVLAGSIGSYEAIRRPESVPVEVLPAGTPVRSPGELLTTGGAVELLAGLRRRFDVIVVDSSALGPVADAAAVAAEADAVLLVCRHGRSTRDQIDETLGLLESVSAPVVGAALTAVPWSASRDAAEYFAPAHPEARAEAGPPELTAGAAVDAVPGPPPPAAALPASPPAVAHAESVTGKNGAGKNGTATNGTGTNGARNGASSPVAPSPSSGLNSPTVRFGTQWWFGAEPPHRSG